MIINFKEEKIKKEITDFNKHGIVPDSLVAGEVHSAVRNSTGPYSTYLLVIEQTNALEELHTNLETKKSKFKYLYTMSKYRKDMIAVDALFQELQVALFTDCNKKDKYHRWLITVTMPRIPEIVDAINNDINCICKYINTYKSTPLSDMNKLQELLTKLTNQQTAFSDLQSVDIDYLIPI